MSGAPRFFRNRQKGRRWHFGAALFDETDWVLSVDGQRVRIEAKPLELLQVLLLRAGEIVTKDELLDTVWSDVEVVEASLATAILKLRRALGDDRREQRMIETVPRIGYRLAIPVRIELTAPAAAAQAIAAARVPQRWTRIALYVGFTATFALFALTAYPVQRELAASKPPPATSLEDVEDVLRTLDVERMQEILKAGWNPRIHFDDQGNNAINFVLNECEWDPGHDRRRMLLMVRTLYDAGVPVDERNMWGDTSYSIAKAERYCGPDHPVTKLIKVICYAGYKPLGDKCLASYELARRQGAGKTDQPALTPRKELNPASRT